MKLITHLIEKPWGRSDIPDAFGDMRGLQIGEIWYDDGAQTPLPLLIKWLFTSQKLSIQVHPSDDQARARGLPSGKEECWYIIDAEPGAAVAMGTKIALTQDELRRASLDGSIETLMDWKPVRPGDFFYIPSGTVHAIGAGITLVEVQQYADITYRLYDYDRLDNGALRELHLDDGVAVSQAQRYEDSRCGYARNNSQLVDGPFFRLWLLDSEDAFAALPKDGVKWAVPIDGQIYSAGLTGRVGECLLLAPNDAMKFGANARALIAMV
jgi:mannose-6-phosphate isomerase